MLENVTAQLVDESAAIDDGLPRHDESGQALLARGGGEAADAGVSDARMAEQDSFDLTGIEKDVLEAAVVIKNFEQLDISSTRIRELVKRSSSIRYLVADDVREYIIGNSLYRPES